MKKKENRIVSSLAFCLKSTMDCYPLLLLWCLLSILIDVAIPVLNTFFPRTVIVIIMEGRNVRHLILATLFFMISIALLSGGGRLMEKFIFYHKQKINAYYLRLIAGKGFTTDYCNQEKDDFRKLQSESFDACNSVYSPMSKVYDITAQFLKNALGFGIYFILLIRISPLLILFLIVSGFAGYKLNQRTNLWIEDHYSEKLRYQQKADYLSRVSGDIKFAKDIRLYNMAVLLQDVYDSTMKALSGWYRRYAKIVFGVSIGDCGLAMLREGLAYAYLLYLVLKGRMTVADYVLYFSVISGFSIWLQGMLGELHSLYRTDITIRHLREFLNYPEVFRREGGIEIQADMPPGTIELQNLSYRYEGAGSDTLQNMNLTIHPGEHLAIVGLNGAGKTTLMKLLCGLCDPTGGKVLYDGTDITQYNRKSYYKLFAAVFQQYSILPVTLAEIVAESPREEVDEEKVRRCLEQAGLMERIRELKKEIWSEYGRTIYDDGIDLSGGEIQKLLLARALYREKPILILDEPTAALDPISESRLYETYDTIMKGRSAIFISHRLASTRFCDRIVLMENGTVLEEGTHESLLQKKGRYYELFTMQAKYYQENPEEVQI